MHGIGLLILKKKKKSSVMTTLRVDTFQQNLLEKIPNKGNTCCRNGRTPAGGAGEEEEG